MTAKTTMKMKMMRKGEEKTTQSTDFHGRMKFSSDMVSEKDVFKSKINFLTNTISAYNHLSYKPHFSGDKAITSLALDPGGARVLSGGIDYELKFWDFAGMDPSLRSFRGKKPVESHAINDLKYSSSGDKILVCGNLAQYKVLGRDGDELFESVSD